MGLSSSTLQPDELVTFKKLPANVSLVNIKIPESPENRRPTNVKWLIILGVTILVLLPFMIYTLYYADISRITVGYDKCGNACGKKNYKWDGISCSGQDLTTSPYLEYENQSVGGEYEQDTYYCVQSCKEGYTGIFGRCLKTPHHLNTQEGDVITKQTEKVDLGVYFLSVKWQLIISCLLSILVAMGMLFLFRYAVAFVVWGILIGSFVVMLVVTAVCWYFYSNAPSDPPSPFLSFGIFFTIMAIALGMVLIWYRKKIHLVILLLKETIKAVFDMPVLIAIPVFSVFAILILTSIFGITTFYMASAGILQKTMNEYHTYVRNPVMVFTLVYNALVYLWLSQLFTGIQYMIIAGAVAKWYFVRDKSYLANPILTSVSNAFKFHLGTVAMGALIITIIQVIKAIILSLMSLKHRVRMFAKPGINGIERFFKFLSKNAYIITAMHGQAFLKSGKRAAKLIIQNLGDIVAVNYIGDFVLGMAKLLIVIVSVLLSLGIFAIAPGPIMTTHLPSYVFVGVFALVVACIAFGVFETGIDTIFICYCEDKLLNDGMAKPYFMSRNLIEFIQESKEVYGKK